MEGDEYLQHCSPLDKQELTTEDLIFLEDNAELQNFSCWSEPGPSTSNSSGNEFHGSCSSYDERHPLYASEVSNSSTYDFRDYSSWDYGYGSTVPNLQLQEEDMTLELDNIQLSQNAAQGMVVSGHSSPTEAESSDGIEAALGFDGPQAPQNTEEHNFRVPEDVTGPFSKRKSSNPDKPLMRKRTRCPSDWVDEKAKQARAAGCGDCRFKCRSKITMEVRLAVYTEFWALQNVNRQYDYIARHTLCSSHAGLKTKAFSTAFMFPVPGGKMEGVCRKMFFDTLAVSKAKLRTINKKRQVAGSIPPDARGRHLIRPNKITEEMTNDVMEHIKSFPTVASHYCRKDTKKLYIEEDVSITEICRRYKVWMEEKNDTNVVSENYYRKIFNRKFNIKTFKPKKYLCDECTAFKNYPEDQRAAHQQRHDVHIANKHRVRELAEIDKAEARDDPSICVAYFDMEQVLTTPRLDVSMAYYKRKLSVFNFTTFRLVLNEGTCYVWNETVAGKGANEIASCLWMSIHNEADRGVKEFRLYSDNCGAQNRNKMLYSMYYRASQKWSVKITHRYLEKGHTYNEGDSIHARIENSVKNKSVYMQAEWVQFMKTAKVEEPYYTVNEISQKDVFDFAELANVQNWKSVKIMNLREIIVEPNSEFVHYKYQYDEESRPLTLATKKTAGKTYPLKQLRHDKIQLDDGKKQDLLSMCSMGVIPVQYHSIYNQICDV